MLCCVGWHTFGGTNEVICIAYVRDLVIQLLLACQCPVYLDLRITRASLSCMKPCYDATEAAEMSSSIISITKRNHPR